MNRGSWASLVFAALVGLAGGLYYAWAISPVSYIDTAPSSLRADFKADYLTVIASAYASTGDLARAKARLALFGDPNPASSLGALAQQRLAQGWPEAEARALAELAGVLGERPSASNSTPRPPAGPTATLALIPTITRTPTLIPTPAPTRTPTATPGAPFLLASRDQVCDSKIPSPLIQVQVVDAADQPVAGIEVRVIWDTGQDHFFTGLKPELGLGYGDFAITPGVTYTLQLVDSEQPVTGLTAAECTGSDGKAFPGSWMLRFQQPARP